MKIVLVFNSILTTTEATAWRSRSTKIWWRFYRWLNTSTSIPGSGRKCSNAARLGELRWFPEGLGGLCLDLPVDVAAQWSSWIAPEGRWEECQTVGLSASPLTIVRDCVGSWE